MTASPFTSTAHGDKIPGPRGWPLVGVLPLIKRDPLGSIQGFRRDYGDFVHLHNPLFPCFQVSHPDYVTHVLVDNYRNYRKSRFHDMLRPLIGNGLLTSDGDHWRRQRRMIQPAFHQRCIDGHATAMAAAAARLVERWRPLAKKGEPVDVGAEMTRLGMEILVDTLFGGTDASGVIAGQLLRDVAGVQESASSRYVKLFPFAKILTRSAERRRRDAIARLDALMFRLIGEHRATPRPGTLLSFLLAARDPETGQGMDDRDVRDEAMTLLMAGHETTAGTLSWVWHLLARHPDAAARVQAEADAVAGFPVAADVDRLPYTRQVIHETLRLYPPAWVFSREAIAEDRIAGHAVPAGSMVTLSPAVIHRHPDWWEDPDAFEPDRFLPEPSAARPRHVYLPFGAGPRVCVGAQFSLTAMLLSVAGIAARYHLRPVPGQPVVPDPLLSLRPRGGLWMTLSER